MYKISKKYNVDKILYNNNVKLSTKILKQTFSTERKFV